VLDIIDTKILRESLNTAEIFEDNGILPIVIPKIDCINDIPKKYILGYSIPSAYGKTELAPAQFIGRRVHLLGGTPKQQAEYYRLFDTVTSLDNNSINKAARKGTVWQDRFGKEWIWKYRNSSPYQAAITESLSNVFEFWQSVFSDKYLGQLQFF